MKYIVCDSYINEEGLVQNSDPRLFTDLQSARDYLKQCYNNALKGGWLVEDESILEEDSLTLNFVDETTSQLDIFQVEEE